MSVNPNEQDTKERLDPWAHVNPLQAGLDLIANGYSPLLVKMAHEGGKVPMHEGWRTGDMTAERWKGDLGTTYSGQATGIGIRTGEVVCADFDITDAYKDVLQKARAAVFAVLGRSDYLREGNKGFAIMYRNASPIRKIRVAAVAPDDSKQAVEFLGDGQQFVVAGLSKPHRYYVWPDEFLGASPMLTKVADLPEVTPDQIREAAAAVRAVFEAAGWHTAAKVDKNGQPEASEPGTLDKPLTVQMVRDMLACIDPSDLPRVGNVQTGELGWSNVAAGLKAAKVEDSEWDAREEFHNWSATGDNYKDEADCYAMFDNVPAHALKVGGFVKLALAGGYKWPPGFFGQSTPLPDAESLMAKRFGDSFEEDSEPSRDDSTDFGEPESFDCLLSATAKDVEELFPGFIEKRIATFLSGPGNTHKSRLGIQFGVSISSQTEMWGIKPADRATFLYLSSEDDRDEVIRRSQAIARRLKVQSLPSANYWDVRGKKSRLAIMSEGGGCELQPFYHALRSQLLAIPGHKFAVLDSCYDFVSFKGKAKIDEDAVNEFIKRLLDKLCVETDATLLVLWHPSQAGQARDDAGGWSVAWHNSPRARLAISRVKNGVDTFELEVVKRNHGVTGLKLTLHWSDGALLHVSERDKTENEEKIRNACIARAIELAKIRQPLNAKNKPDDETLGKVKDACGFPVSPQDVKGHLQQAALMGKLVYLKSDHDVVAGYYDPCDPWAGEEAGRQSRRAEAAARAKAGKGE